MSSNRVSDEQLLDAIRKRCEFLGRQPGASELGSMFTGYPLTTYRRRFGSVQKALEAAGVTDVYPPAPKHVWKAMW